MSLFGSSSLNQNVSTPLAATSTTTGISNHLSPNQQNPDGKVSTLFGNTPSSNTGLALATTDQGLNKSIQSSGQFIENKIPSAIVNALEHRRLTDVAALWEQRLSSQATEFSTESQKMMNTDKELILAYASLANVARRQETTAKMITDLEATVDTLMEQHAALNTLVNVLNDKISQTENSDRRNISDASHPSTESRRGPERLVNEVKRIFNLEDGIENLIKEINSRSPLSLGARGSEEEDLHQIIKLLNENQDTLENICIQTSQLRSIT